MYYSDDKRKQITKYLNGLRISSLTGLNESEKIARALFDCITTDDNHERTEQEKVNNLLKIIDPNGTNKIDKIFSGSGFSALEHLMNSKCAEIIKNVWGRASLYPYSYGYYRKPFRSVKNTRLYLSHNLELLQEMVYSNAFGEYDLETELRKKREYYMFSRLTAEVLAYELDSGNEKVLNIARDIVYGDNQNGIVSRELIYGLLMSRNLEAHKIIGDLLIAAKLQEGLRQAVVESMDEGSREGYLYILKLILDNDLMRFSSVARALNTSTGLLLPPEKPAVLKKCYEIAWDCLNDKNKLVEYSQSSDNLKIYMSLWAAAFDEITDVEQMIKMHTDSEYKYRRLTAMYFLSNSFFPELQNEISIKMLSSDDFETCAWCIKNLFSGCALNSYTLSKPENSTIPSSSTQREIYELLKSLLNRLTKKETTFNESVFNWCEIKLTVSDVIEKMVLCASISEDDTNELIDEILDFKDKMSVDTREGLISHFISKPKTTKQKTYLVEALGDKSSSVRNTANNAIKRLDLSESDFLIIEEFLQYKSADLRKNCIATLLRQDSANIFESVKRLLNSSLANKRLGAIELVSGMKGDENFVSVYKDCENLLKDSDKLTQVEKIRISEITDSETPAYTPENGFGLYNPDVLYSPAIPNDYEKHDAKKILVPDIKRVKEFFSKISDTIHQNREYQYEVTYHGGSKETKVLGADTYVWNFSIDYNKDFGIDNIPLGDTWKNIVSEMNVTDDELLSFQYVYRVFTKSRRSEMNAYDFHMDKTDLIYNASDRDEMTNFFKKLMYYNICKFIISALVISVPSEKKFTNAYNISRCLYNAIPVELHSELYENEDDYKSYFCECIQVSHWLYTLREASTIDSYKTYFDISYLFYKASGYIAGNSTCSLGIYDFGRAFEMGIINENELLFEICGRKSSHHHLNQLTSDILNQHKRPLECKLLYETAKKAVNRIVSIELLRGEMPTCVSKLAGSIRICNGIEFFAQIIPKMEKDSYVRGYMYADDDSTKKDMFSHLLKCCYPNPEDNADKLRELLSETKIKDEQLIEAAMYAPQWLDIVEEYLGWDGLRCAAWYFHAHTSDSISNEDQAIVAHFSPIEPSDFQDGAFDVSWFWEAYNTVGEKRFKMVYNAAKYVSSAGQHKRAQLFADAVTGSLDAEVSENTIRDKRNKDVLLAYALIPLKDRRDALRRYEFIQAYLKQSKQFGSQRQLSEGTASRIALTNLSRNAGFADSNRFMWQMETDKIDEISEFFKPNSVEGIEVRIVFDNKGLAEVEATKDGKQLKDIPSKLKKQPVITSIKAVQKELKQQHSRARLSLENAMVSSDEFEISELKNLENNPVLCPLIRNLVFVAGDKHGFYVNGALVDFDGNSNAIESEKLRIAHPHDLFSLGVWGNYQHSLFSREIVQPFKQVFREYYKPTADELNTLTYSNRYAGHQVQPKKTLALLKSRGWSASYETGLQKVLIKENIIVSVYAMADWFSPADIESPTLEATTFYDRKTYKPRSIDSISPILFSEIMRDLDLVVSVAHAGGVDPEASFSTIEMRESILNEILKLMKIQNVEIRKTHAFIKGSIGEYVVHLGSGTVQKMATGDIYIIPVHSQHRGRIFLPFMDEDPKTSEIVSKIILLAEDQKIKDPEILRQIN